MYDDGVRGQRLSLNRFVELVATNPARLMGLYPRKGTIAVGSDADIVVFDPEKTMTISASSHHSRRLQPVRRAPGDRRAGDGAAARDAGHGGWATGRPVHQTLALSDSVAHVRVASGRQVQRHAAASWTRECSPSFSRLCWRWLAAVRSVITSTSAI